MVFHEDDVAGSWLELVARLDAAEALGRWAAREPTLAGVAGVGDLAELTCAGCDRVRADAVLGALVRWAAADGGDDPDAVLVLVHLLADGVWALAARLRDLADDLPALIVGELTAQIRAFPWRRRRRAFAANLLLDTRAAVLRDLGLGRHGWHRRGEVLIDPLDEWRLLNIGGASEVWCGWRGCFGSREPTAAEELADLLAWVAEQRLVPVADLRLVWDLESARGYGKAARATVAAAYGVNERTVRRRRDRTLAALRAVTGDYLAAA